MARRAAALVDLSELAMRDEAFAQEVMSMFASDAPPPPWETRHVRLHTAEWFLSLIANGTPPRGDYNFSTLAPPRLGRLMLAVLLWYSRLPGKTLTIPIDAYDLAALLAAAKHSVEHLTLRCPQGLKTSPELCGDGRQPETRPEGQRAVDPGFGLVRDALARFTRLKSLDVCGAGQWVPHVTSVVAAARIPNLTRLVVHIDFYPLNMPTFRATPPPPPPPPAAAEAAAASWVLPGGLALLELMCTDDCVRRGLGAAVVRDCPGLESLTLLIHGAGTEANEAIPALLSGLVRLRHVSLSGIAVTEALLKSLRGAPSLESLSMIHGSLLASAVELPGALTSLTASVSVTPGNCPSLSELGQSGGRRRPAGSASFQASHGEGVEAGQGTEGLEASRAGEPGSSFQECQSISLLAALRTLPRLTSLALQLEEALFTPAVAAALDGALGAVGKTLRELRIHGTGRGLSVEATHALLKVIATRCNRLRFLKLPRLSCRAADPKALEPSFLGLGPLAAMRRSPLAGPTDHAVVGGSPSEAKDFPLPEGANPASQCCAAMTQLAACRHLEALTMRCGVCMQDGPPGTGERMRSDRAVADAISVIGSAAPGLQRLLTGRISSAPLSIDHVAAPEARTMESPPIEGPRSALHQASIPWAFPLSVDAARNLASQRKRSLYGRAWAVVAAGLIRKQEDRVKRARGKVGSPATPSPGSAVPQTPSLRSGSLATPSLSLRDSGALRAPRLASLQPPAVPPLLMPLLPAFVLREIGSFLEWDPVPLLVC